MGGHIFDGRVSGQLAMSRAIGDHMLTSDGVIPIPTINRIVLKQTDKWLIIATDGVWDWLDERELNTLIDKNEFSAQNLAQSIVKESLNKGSKDNITCLVIRL